jgi:hypothetical protein
LRARCIGEYLELSGSKKQMVVKKKGIMRRFILLILGRSAEGG